MEHGSNGGSTAADVPPTLGGGGAAPLPMRLPPGGGRMEGKDESISGVAVVFTNNECVDPWCLCQTLAERMRRWG